MTNLNRLSRYIVCIAMLLGAIVPILSMPAFAAKGSAPDTLAWVNGEAVTSEDLDALLLMSHESRDMTTMHSEDLPNYLKKAVNDRLLVQDAMAIGMDEDSEVKNDADEFLEREAVKAYVRDAFHPPMQADSLAVRAYFEKYYWQISLRQVSVRSRAEAESIRQAVLAGADMDSLARVRSLDSHSLRGGLHNLKYWGDVENVLREAVSGVDTGDLSEVFPLRESFAFLRVEDKSELDEKAFEGLKKNIRAIILKRERDLTFAAFLDSLESVTPLHWGRAELDSIRQDAGIVFTGRFLREQPGSVLSMEGEDNVTGTGFRRVVSRTAMMDGTAPIDSIFHDTEAYERQQLLLRGHARKGGYFENGMLLDRRREKLEQLLIEAYLQEMIVPRIVFNRAEFQEFYDSNQDIFRGADEVMLEMVIIEDESEAKEMVARLTGGADFDFLRNQYLGKTDPAGGSMRWTSSDVFAGKIQEAIMGMAQGETSEAIETRGGWMIFKLRGRRKGKVKPLEEVEMQIREIMFQRKFNEILDEHLKLLKERSDIRMNQKAIEVYFGQGS